MAKELPYFKFEPSEWENGIIQICSRESKGLFIDICAMYWSRLGDLPYKLVLQKLCNGNPNALHELMQEQVFSIADEQIVIKFLDIQLSEFGHKSDQASKAAKARWSKHNKNKGENADAMQTHSKRNAIREEKKREEKIIIPSVFEFIDYCKSKQPNIDESHAKLKFEQWVENGWKDGYNKPIKMWKSKANGVIPHLKTIEVKAEPKYKRDKSISHHF